MIIKFNKIKILSSIFFIFVLISISPSMAINKNTNSAPYFSNTQAAFMIVGAVSLVSVGLAALFLSGNKDDKITNYKQKTTLKVINISPINEATDIALNQNINIIFNKKINQATLNDDVFILKTLSGDLISGEISCDGASLLFAPKEYLAINTTYVAIITTDVKDIDGDSLVTNYIWVFTTKKDIIDNKNVIEKNDVIGNNKSITNDDNNNNLTIDPILLHNNKNLSQTSFSKVFNSTLQKFYDLFNEFCLSAPKIINIDPSDKEVNVKLEASIVVKFNNKMNLKTINSNTFIVKNENGELIDGVFEYDYENQTAIFTRKNENAWDEFVTYNVTITNDIEDIKENNLSKSYSWSFTTEKDEMPRSPKIIETKPDNESKNIKTSEFISILFDRPMNQSTLNTDTVIIINKDNNLKVAGSMAINQNMSSTFIPENLLKSTKYQVLITNKVLDVNGNSLVDGYSWTFTTGDI